MFEKEELVCEAGAIFLVMVLYRLYESRSNYDDDVKCANIGNRELFGIKS